MKKVFLPLLFLFTALQMQAQITIEYTDFPLNTNGDTLKAGTISVALPEEGANMVYDYSASSLSPNPSYTVNSLTHSNPDFSANSLRRIFNYPGFIGGFVSNYLFRTFDSQCYCMEGYEEEGYVRDVSGFTGTSGDEIERLANARIFPTPLPWFTFPMNYGDNYVTLNRTSTDFLFKGPSFTSIPNNEVTKIRNTTDSITVNGWGIALLTNPNTSMVDTFEVLYLRRATTRIDSFYDNTGAAIDGALLTSMNTSQGAEIKVVFHELYTKGTAKAVVTWEEYPGIGSTSSFVSLDAFDEAYAVSDNEVKAALVSHRVFPNPVVNQQFQLELDKNNAENWQLEIYNNIGQVAHLQNVTDNITAVALDSKMGSGAYFYAVKNELGEIVARGQLSL
ncbi:MAG: T9SS type A sorting domain-containing protein [Saprospiraceae bacterium]